MLDLLPLEFGIKVRICDYNLLFGIMMQFLSQIGKATI